MELEGVKGSYEWRAEFNPSLLHPLNSLSLQRYCFWNEKIKEIKN